MPKKKKKLFGTGLRYFETKLYFHRIPCSYLFYPLVIESIVISLEGLKIVRRGFFPYLKKIKNKSYRQINKFR